MTLKVSRAELLRTARRHFGIRAFRPGQLELIEAALGGQHALGILPTGSGKSLTFQLPALCSEGIVVVISPLIALMQDQVDKLTELDIPSVALNSSLTAQEERDALAAIAAGAVKLVYVTPERLEKESCIELLRTQHVALLVVDEAHCVSQWGHDFRPAFLAIRDAVRDLGKPPVLALTATATPEVIDDIVAQLGMEGAAVVNTGLERENLFLEVQRTPRAGQKRELLLSLIGASEGTGIVYAATIRLAEELFELLDGAGIATGLYHGKRKHADRETAQRRFMNDEFKVMVATSAFGLGIDKPNLRFVIHYNFPDSLETYYQEAGRAGRDGEKARATLLYRLEDKRLQTYFLGGKYPKREELLRIVASLRVPPEPGKRKRGLLVSELASRADSALRRVKAVVSTLEGASVVTRKAGRIALVADGCSEADVAALLDSYEEKQRSDRARLETMMHYAQRSSCRMQLMREYFGDESGEPCSHCDNCVTPAIAPPSRRTATSSSASPAMEDAHALERLAASAVGDAVDPRYLEQAS